MSSVIYIYIFKFSYLASVGGVGYWHMRWKECGEHVGVGPICIVFFGGVEFWNMRDEKSEDGHVGVDPICIVYYLSYWNYVFFFLSFFYLFIKIYLRKKNKEKDMNLDKIHLLLPRN